MRVSGLKIRRKGRASSCTRMGLCIVDSGSSTSNGDMGPRYGLMKPTTQATTLMGSKRAKGD